MEKKIVTLAELKGEKVRLRNEIENDGYDMDMEKVKDYWKVRAKVEIVESVLLWTILTLMIFISGCQTFKGATGDSAWILQKLSDNVNTQEK